MSHVIKLIAFDVFGVILSEGHLISNVLMHLLPEGSTRKSVKEQYEAYNIGLISEVEFWQSVDINDYARIRQTFINSFELDPDYFEVISELSSKYPLAILSNLPADWAQAMMERFNFEQTFKHCLFSGFVGCKKPHHEIYQLLIDQSGFVAGNIAFIDDRLENLQTAHELGMTTIYYQREKETHAFKAEMELDQLGLLPNLLKSQWPGI